MSAEVAPTTDLATLATVAEELRELDALRAVLVEQRARALVAARVAGVSWGTLQDATGLTRQALNLIARDANGGELPVPR